VHGGPETEVPKRLITYAAKILGILPHFDAQILRHGSFLTFTDDHP
jgi:hypothetical protein